MLCPRAPCPGHHPALGSPPAHTHTAPEAQHCWLASCATTASSWGHMGTDRAPLHDSRHGRQLPAAPAHCRATWDEARAGGLWCQEVGVQGQRPTSRAAVAPFNEGSEKALLSLCSPLAKTCPGDQNQCRPRGLEAGLGSHREWGHPGPPTGPSCLLQGGLPAAARPPPDRLMGLPGSSSPCLDPPSPWWHPAVPPGMPSPCSFPLGPFGAPLPQHPHHRHRLLLHPQQPDPWGAVNALCRGPGGGWQPAGALLHRSWASLLLVAGPGGERASQAAAMP